MAGKRKEEQPLEQVRYSTAGLDSRADVEKALQDTVYRPSQNVTDAAAALKEWQEKRPTEYQSSYQEKIDSLLEQLLARENFRYDHTKDPLYRQYEQLYTQNAHNASADAAAQAAALTGGYGSSYAVSAAQQAYQQQIGALNNAVPTLYSLALDTYNSGGEEIETRLEQLNSQEQAAQKAYEKQLQEHYAQLERMGEAYNQAYVQDYGEYQDHLGKLGELYDRYAEQEQVQAAGKQQRFNNAMTILGVLGDVLQLAISGTTGLGSLAGSLMNTGYNIYADDRSFKAEREDAQWAQQLQEKQRQDELAQQKYDNAAAEREYQDALKQQQFANRVTSDKLDIAKGEWALKQAEAQKKAEQAAAPAAGRSTGQNKAAEKESALASGKNGVPYTAVAMRSQGKSDIAIRSALSREGYSAAQIAKILKEMNE